MITSLCAGILLGTLCFSSLVVDYDAPNRIGYLFKNLMGTYPGSLGNYAGVHLGVPVVTLELPHAGIMPTNQQIRNLWTDLVRWLVRHM